MAPRGCGGDMEAKEMCGQMLLFLYQEAHPWGLVNSVILCDEGFTALLIMEVQINFSVNDHKFMTSIQLPICLSIWSLDFVTNFSQFHLLWIYWTNFNLIWHKHPLVKGFLKKSFGILFVLNIGWNFKTLCQKTVLLLKGLFHSTILIYWISTQNTK